MKETEQQQRLRLLNKCFADILTNPSFRGKGLQSILVAFFKIIEELIIDVGNLTENIK